MLTKPYKVWLLVSLIFMCKNEANEAKVNLPTATTQRQEGYNSP